MPFTPTHVIAVLPIAAVFGRWLPFSALMIGAMIPDWPLFVPLSPAYGTTHSALGVVIACWPLGMACFLCFQYLLKQPLFALLPNWVRSRIADYARPPVRFSISYFVGVSLAVMIGAATHDVWDSFTHKGRWGTRWITPLSETTITVSDYPVPGYRVLQYGSTLIGLPLLTVFLAIWLHRRTPADPKYLLERLPNLRASWKWVAYAATVLIPLGIAFVLWQAGQGSNYELFGQWIKTSGLGLMIAAVAFSIVFRLKGHGRA